MMMSWTRIARAGCTRAVALRSTRIVPSASASATSATATTIHRAGIATATQTRSMMALDEFRDATPRQQRMEEPVGRSWNAETLRRKSFDDLHKLWYVLYKERNMLFTERQLSKRKSIVFPQPERVKKVRKSMGAIKQVLGERKEDIMAAAALKQMDQADKNFADGEDDDDVGDLNAEESLQKT